MTWITVSERYREAVKEWRVGGDVLQCRVGDGSGFKDAKPTVTAD